jgi:hypothetical protein
MTAFANVTTIGSHYTALNTQANAIQNVRMGRASSGRRLSTARSVFTTRIITDRGNVFAPEDGLGLLEKSIVGFAILDVLDVEDLRTKNVCYARSVVILKINANALMALQGSPVVYTEGFVRVPVWLVQDQTHRTVCSVVLMQYGLMSKAVYV